MPKKYSDDFRASIAHMAIDKVAAEKCSQRAALDSVGQSLGVSLATLRSWIRRDNPVSQDLATPPPESLEEENRRLRRELAEARRANEILKKASAFSLPAATAPRKPGHAALERSATTFSSRKYGGSTRKTTACMVTAKCGTRCGVKGGSSDATKPHAS